MVDKQLAEAGWKSFAKGRGLDDAALLKALAKLARADDDQPGEQLVALDELEVAAKKLGALQLKRKGDKGAAEVAARVDDLLAAVGRQRKAAQAAQAAQAKKATQAEEDDADSPALLTTKMLPLVRELRKGEARMAALICVAGKNSAVLIMRRAIATTRRKMLAEAAGAQGGAKFIVGHCLLENDALTFVVGSPAAGLAKRLRQALLDQIGLRLKVRVRGDDGSADEEGDDAPDGPVDAPSVTPTAPPAVAVPDAAERAYGERLKDLMPRFEQALRDLHPEATKLRALMAFASEKADEQQAFGVATQALASLARLLDAAPLRPPGAPATAAKADPPPNPQGDGGATTDPSTAFKARLAALLPRLKLALAQGVDAPAGGEQARGLVAEAGAWAAKRDFDAAHAVLDRVESWLARPPALQAGLVALQQSRLAWDGLRKTVQTQLQGLEQALLAGVRSHNAERQIGFRFDEATAATRVRRIYGILDRLDTRLIDALDAALNADGSRRSELQSQAATLVGEYRTFVDSDPMIAAIDDNGFIATSIRSEAQRTLNDLARQL